jgi:ABC-type Fe3+/spermidine/putrescine transport system ATPase subunit
VGEFIGDSNIFAGTVDESGPGCVTLDALGPVRVDVDAWRRVGQGAVDVLVRPEGVQLAAPGAEPGLPNQLVMSIDVIVNYGDSVLVIGSARGQRLRMRIAGAQPDSVREGATVTVGWRPGDEHLIAR